MGKIETDILKIIQYNLDNFGCVDPLECASIDEFKHGYYRNLDDDAEREGDCK